MGKTKYTNQHLGKIYKITNTIDEKIYIGSTIETYLSSRWKKHRQYKSHKNYQKGLISLLWGHYDLLGFENFNIELLFECPKENVKIEEQKFIELLKPQLNQSNAFGLDVENKKNLGKKHYNENKEYYQNYGKTKLKCECGLEVSYWSKRQHLKSLLHQRLLKQI